MGRSKSSKRVGGRSGGGRNAGRARGNKLAGDSGPGGGSAVAGGGFCAHCLANGRFDPTHSHAGPQSHDLDAYPYFGIHTNPLHAQRPLPADRGDDHRLLGRVQPVPVPDRNAGRKPHPDCTYPHRQANEWAADDNADGSALYDSRFDVNPPKNDPRCKPCLYTASGGAYDHLLTFTGHGGYLHRHPYDAPDTRGVRRQLR